MYDLAGSLVTLMLCGGGTVNFLISFGRLQEMSNQEQITLRTQYTFTFVSSLIKNEILFPLHVDFDEKFMTNLQFVVEECMEYYYDYF